MKHCSRRILSGSLAAALTLGLLASPAAAAKTFFDVSASHWFKPYVDKVVDADLMTGMDDGTFDPQGSLTLAQTMVLAYQIHVQSQGGQLPQNVSGPWYMPYYQYCLDKGVVSSRQYGQGELTRKATRFDMVAILDKTVPEDQMAPINDLDDGFIPDLDEDDRYGDVVYKWYRAGALSGDEEHRFHGPSNITRAEVSVILCQLTGLIDRVELAEEPSYEDFSMGLSESTVEVGGTAEGLMFFPDHVSDRTVTWSSSNPSVASIDRAGNITAHRAGDAEITAATNGYTFSAWLTVVEPEPEVDPEAYAEEVLRLVNEERAKVGLHALVLDGPAQEAAMVRAQELTVSFSHTRPDGRTCFTALSEAGSNYWYAGENIAWGYSSPAAVVQGWMNSEGHRANILNEDFTGMGLGWATGDYWAQMFVGVK